MISMSFAASYSRVRNWMMPFLSITMSTGYGFDPS